MNIAVLCPTYGRGPKLLGNAVACFEAQTWKKARLLILDDGGDVPESEGERWHVRQRAGGRAPNLGAKYNDMVAWFGDWPSAYVVWDSDDVYLPEHLAGIADALARGPWAHPAFVWSTYAAGPRSPRMEGAAGRFHGSLAVRRDALAAIGGWVDTRRADFDQQILSKLRAQFGPPVDPCPNRPTYVFRWADTGETHCQGLMLTPADQSWWERVPRRPWPNGAKLEPAFDQSAVELFAALEGRDISRETAGPLRFIRTVDLARDAVELAGQVPANAAAVVGVPRSGMIPAAIVATYLHRPLYAWTQERGLQAVGSGERFARETPEPGRLAVIDDSICTGHQLRAVRSALPGAWFGAVYAPQSWRREADGVGAVCDQPHLFEWNLFNSGFLDGAGAPWPWLRGGIALDWDGVVCEDCPAELDGDDTPAGDANYLAWLRNARPKHLPRRSVVPMVATFRLSKFAADTRAWAERYGVRVADWHFHHAATFAERAAVFDVAEHKGEAFARSPAGLFIESDRRQAPAIAARARKPVVALDSGEVFRG